jgi:hypothetical protein
MGIRSGSSGRRLGTRTIRGSSLGGLRHPFAPSVISGRPDKPMSACFERYGERPSGRRTLLGARFVARPSVGRWQPLPQPLTVARSPAGPRASTSSRRPRRISTRRVPACIGSEASSTTTARAGVRMQDGAGHCPRARPSRRPIRRGHAPRSRNRAGAHGADPCRRFEGAELSRWTLPRARTRIVAGQGLAPARLEPRTPRFVVVSAGGKNASDAAGSPLLRADSAGTRAV